MNKQRKTSHILNVFQYDHTTGAVTLPAGLSLPTPDSTDNSTKVATTAWIRAYVGSLSYATASSVETAIANLVASAPTTLNTLNELATALGNDPNFATTITTSIGTKVPQSRTITINGTAYDLSADRAWTIASGVTSFNTRTGAIVLSSADVTGALGYTPYNSTNPSGYITSSGSISGSAGSVAWSGVSAGTRTNYTLAFQPPSGDYAGFQFMGTNGAGAGYFLIRGTSDSDVYTAEGITLVADQGWLTLAQRTTANRGIRFMTGSSTSVNRMQIDNSGLVTAYVNLAVGNQQGFDNPGGWNKNILIDGTHHGRFRIKASNHTYGNIDVSFWADSSVSPSHGIFGSNAVFSFGGSITSLTVGGQTVIHTGNIGNQSVYYATTAGSVAYGNIVATSKAGWMTEARNGTGSKFYLGHADGYGMHINTYTASSSVYALELHNSSKQLFAVMANGAAYLDGGNQILHAANYNSYALPLAGGTMSGDITYINLRSSADSTYGLIGRNGYLDTLNGRGSDPLELNYYDGGPVIIGQTANGSKSLYAGALYDAGSRVAISRGEGRNYVEYSRYVYNNGAYSGSGWIEPSDLGVRYAASANYASSAGSASSASHLPTAYAGGVQSNPQVYFNYGIGLKVAMTGHWSVWSDTLWVNGYAGGDVPWMCALHFLRNSEPRFAISAQQRDSGSYGSIYEVITSYNIANQTVSTANNLSGFDKTNPSFGAVYASNWFRAQGDCGLYTQDYGGHFRRNTYSYGTWETFGYNKNGYGGIVVSNNYVTAQMHNSSGDYGFLTENGNWWNLFYNNGNNCWGIGTDNTYSGDGFRCVKYGSSQYGWTTWSDRRAKENISSITGALDKVLNMRGVYFNYITDEAKSKRVGFIAQELEQVLPEAVRYAEEIDEYNVEYAQIVSVLAEAIKEQDVKMKAQDAKITRLEALVEQLTNN